MADDFISVTVENPPETMYEATAPREVALIQVLQSGQLICGWAAVTPA